MTAMWAARGVATAAFAAAVCAGLIVILRPTLRRYALARPNERSSHREPTPQGGGIAVIAATVATTWLGILGFDATISGLPAIVLAAGVAMACVGATDDIHPLAVAPRLLLQAVAVGAVLYALPDDLRVVPAVPWWLERLALFVAVLWFVNLVNFMDGLDWMTVAEVVPITAALVVLGYVQALPFAGTVLALALGGATIGFAYFNRPVAKLFLGDVGSLPIGLWLGWLLVLVAGNGNLAAALLLPLYYFADATITVLRRLVRGERFWQSHRTHYYQRATDRGFSVTEVVARVFAVNIGLTALALVTVIAHGTKTDIAALACGAALVGWLLRAFARGR